MPLVFSIKTSKYNRFANKKCHDHDPDQPMLFKEETRYPGTCKKAGSKFIHKS